MKYSIDDFIRKFPGDWIMHNYKVFYFQSEKTQLRFNADDEFVFWICLDNFTRWEKTNDIKVFSKYYKKFFGLANFQ